MPKTKKGTALVPTNGASATQLAFDLGARLEPTGMELTNPDLTYDDWENIGRCIGFVGNAWQWWVGDWINFGDKLFGEEAAAAIDDRATRYDVARRVTGGIPVGTLTNIASICARIAKSRRRPELTIYQHEPVAALEPDDQTMWLTKAVDEQWSRDDLRAALREAAGDGKKTADPPPSPPGGISISEQIEHAARLVWAQAQRATDHPGFYLVAGEPMAQLGAALGESQ